MIETILLVLLVAKLKKFKLKPLLKEWSLYPLFILELTYLFFQLCIWNNIYIFVNLSGIYKYLYMISLLIPMFKYKLYIQGIIGSNFIFLGTALNKIAIAFNDGKMPVFPTLSYITNYVKSDSFQKVNDIHILGCENTKVKFLTDIIDTGYSVMSIGDILIRAYVFIIIYATIKNIQNKNNNKLGY
ncbi:DUF5317 family protein [Clostridium tarantellae]|uniref:DUF5317 domain-containing protein n=1 Tax=Clostridium tarantellae TaxID=39493 RepID=A0A6I1MQ29_9CLOT|nr:DUF5317 family protein [Clostridium tarantellae]MPQ45164.1 hypothetical protein [Clostridium tarantellae]